MVFLECTRCSAHLPAVGAFLLEAGPRGASSIVYSLHNCVFEFWLTPYKLPSIAFVGNFRMSMWTLALFHLHVLEYEGGFPSAAPLWVTFVDMLGKVQ